MVVMETDTLSLNVSVDMCAPKKCVRHFNIDATL